MRCELIRRLELSVADNSEQQQLLSDLDDIFLTVQAYSYPGNYVAEQPSIERIAETLDKFEEDVLQVRTATIRGTRAVDVIFDEPIPVVAAGSSRMTVADLTTRIEQRVRSCCPARSGSRSLPAAESADLR